MSELALAIIGSVGGAGIIIVFVGKWLAQLIADKLMQKSQSEYDKQLEYYKRECEIEIQKLQYQNERATYISNVQFETEFKIYQEIFSLLFDFKQTAYMLYPTYDELPRDAEEQKNIYNKRYSEFAATYNQFLATKEKYSPFIPLEIYQLLSGITKLAQSLGVDYPEIKLYPDERFQDDYKEMVRENYKKSRELNKEYEEIQSKVRNYLETLKNSHKEES